MAIPQLPVHVPLFSAQSHRLPRSELAHAQNAPQSDCLTKLEITKEKQFMLDIMCLRQGYQRRLISEIWCINDEDKPADAMINAKDNGALGRLIDTNELNPKLRAWVVRDGGHDVGATKED